MIEDSVLKFLLANAGVSAIASNGFGDRIPEDESLPALTITCIDFPQVAQLLPYNATCYPMLTVRCWATRESTAKQLAKAVRDAFRGFTPGASMDTQPVQWVEIRDGQRDHPVPSKTGDDIARYCCEIDVVVWFNE